MRPSLRIGAILVALAAPCGARGARAADSIQLLDGTVMSGRVISVTDREVKIEVRGRFGSATMAFPARKVHAVSRGGKTRVINDLPKAEPSAVPAAGGRSGALRRTRPARAVDGPPAAGGPLEYPSWRGPFSNGSAAPSGRTLVADAARARKLWTNDQELVEGYVGAGWGYRGTYAQPVMSGGRIYVPYWEPTGEHLMTKLHEHAQKSRRLPEAHKKRERWFLDADDVLLCVDAPSGRTLWRARFEGGLNHSGDNPPPVHMAACVSGGRVYFTGTGGLAHSADAATGEKVWSEPVPGARESWLKIREQCIEKGELPGKQRGGYRLCANPCVAGPVLVAHNGWKGLVGLDLRNGRAAWGPVKDANDNSHSPVVWRVGGRELVVACMKKRATCVDPATGKVVWTDPRVRECATPAVAGDVLICGGNVDKIKHKFGKDKHGYEGFGVNAWRMSASGLEPLWRLPLADRVKTHAGITVWDGHAYASVQVGEPGSKNTKSDLICIEIATGKVTGRTPSDAGYASLVSGDGMIVENGGGAFFLYAADPANLRRLGGPMKASCGDSITPILVGGVLYARGSAALGAYDLGR